MKHSSRVALIVVLGAGLQPGAAQVPCDPATFGNLEVDPLTIAGAFDLPDGCTLDFGDREVILHGALRGADLTILAGDLTVEGRGSIEGGVGTTTIVLRSSRLHSGSARLDGPVVSSGTSGGGVVIDADGDVRATPAGQIEAMATAASGLGGLIDIAAGGAIALDAGPALAAAGGELAEFPGSVELRTATGAIVVEREVRVSSGALGGRGRIAMTAGATLAVTADLTAAGGCSGETCRPAGQVLLGAAADLTLKGNVDVAGAETSPLGSEASGGEVTLDAAGSILLTGEVLRLEAGPAGSGGALRARCDGDYRQESSVQASGPGETANGGAIEIACGGSAMVIGATAASGGPAGLGGTFSLEAGEDASIVEALDISGNYPQGGCQIVALGGSATLRGILDASGRGDFGTGAPVSILANVAVELDGARIVAAGAGANGLGGAVVLDALQAVTLGGPSLVDVGGDLEDARLGEGGTADAVACEVLVAAASGIRAAGAAGGTIAITASNGMAVLGHLDAETDGLILLRLAPGLVPDLTGASLSPRPLRASVPNVPECIVPPPCDQVSDVRCVAGPTSVTVTWQRSPGHTQTLVARDGVVIATLGAGVESHVDEDPADGMHTYLVTGSCFEASSAGADCSVRFPGGATFQRGDCNVSLDADISDAIFVLGFLFQGTQERLHCEDACDVNDDGANDISDAIALLTFLFIDSSQPLPAPAGSCGADPTADALLCEGFDACP